MSAASAVPVLADLGVGDVVAERSLHLTRDSLVRYAGASGDFNPIHYRDDVAASVGLPGVLAHGMLTMGQAVQPVADWAGDPARSGWGFRCQPRAQAFHVEINDGRGVKRE